MSELTWQKYAVHNDTVISGFFGPYRFLSNFWAAPVEYKGVRFTSTEEAYQAAKATTPEDFKRFIGIGQKEAKALGNRISLPADWDDKKISIMEYLVFQKFSRHVGLRESLIQTDERTLIEANHWRDRFWGVYYKMNADLVYVEDCGLNHLGHILMRVRTALR